MTLPTRIRTAGTRTTGRPEAQRHSRPNHTTEATHDTVPRPANPPTRTLAPGAHTTRHPHATHAPANDRPAHTTEAADNTAPRPEHPPTTPPTRTLAPGTRTARSPEAARSGGQPDAHAVSAVACVRPARRGRPLPASASASISAPASRKGTL
ncbi:hypothetical protein [Streptomyces sp. NPDC047042]|uniref:hypothetical protein n=1 Tax=Streptomyces sp. NPDC047042 TaxID=3154807 RepID=UPI0034080DA0